MADISTKTRISRLFGTEKIPILDHGGQFNYTDLKAMRKALAEARIGSFTKWEAAKARGASAPPRVLFCGDSNVMGQGANSGTTLFTKGFARAFAEQMGWKTGSFVGHQNRASNTIANFKAYNPTFTSTGGWVTETVLSLLGAGWLRANATGTLTWAPTEAFDKLRLWYPRTTGLNTAVTVTIDGALVDTIDMSGTAALLFKDYSVSLGTHTVVVSSIGTASAFVGAMELWDTTNGTPVYLQAGWYGSKAADFALTAEPWSTLNEMQTMGPDYVFQYCTINDLVSSTDLRAYADSMEAFIKGAEATADVCLLWGFPPNTNLARNGTGDAMARILQNLAEDYDCSYMDTRNFFGHSYNRCSDLGYAFDGSHPNQAGHDLLADALYAFLGDCF